MTQKNKFLTFMFALVPGVGHLYLGLNKRGLQLMIGAFASISFIRLLPTIFPFVLAVIWFYSLFDALQKVTIINNYVAHGQTSKHEQTQIEDESSLQGIDKSIIVELQLTQVKNFIEPLWLGIACIVIGFLTFVRILFPDIWLWLRHVHFESSLLAIVLIGFGIWLIRKQTRNQ